MKELNEAEQMILGAVLATPEYCDKVFELLKPEHFLKSEHRDVYTEVLEMKIKGLTPDMLTVTKGLKAKNKLESIGGAFFVSSLTNKIPTEPVINNLIYIVLESFMRSELFKMSTSIGIKTNELTNDVFDILTEAENSIKNIQNNISISQIDTIEKVKDAYIESAHKVVVEGISEGVKCGIRALNNQTNGWQKSDLIIVAGRPGMGKSSAALEFALTPAINKIPVVFFSLEMSSEQLTARALSILSGIDVQKVVNKTLNAGELKTLNASAFELNNIPLFLDDTPNISLLDLKIRCNKIKREHGLNLVIVDYLQLMRSGLKTSSREQEVSEISRGLKALAKELKVPVIALSQLSRENEKRADKKPMLSDLRESGSIEQDADMVIFCHRPEYYGLPTYQIGDSEVPSENLFIFNIAKFRNGSTGDVKARWIGNNTKVTSWDIEQPIYKRMEENTGFLNNAF